MWLYKDLSAIERCVYYKILFQSTISMLRIHSFFSGEPLPPWFYFRVRDFYELLMAGGILWPTCNFFMRAGFYDIHTQFLVYGPF